MTNTTTKKAANSIVGKLTAGILAVAAVLPVAPVAAQGAGGSALVVGDSLEVGSAPYLRGALAGVPLELDAKRSRSSSEGLRVLASKLGPEHEVVVFPLGTNDFSASAFASNLAAARELAGQRCMVVATIARPNLRGSSTADLNRVVEQFAGTGNADWYVWADAKPDGSPPNNWQAMFGGCAWTWDARRRQYYLHNFLPEQPDLNVRNPAVQDALLDVARFWLERGVDGFRLDVVNFFTHDAELRDNPPIATLKRAPPRPHQFQRHLYDRTQPETLQFIARLRALLDQYGAMAVGEIEDEEPLKVQRDYTDGPDRLHTAYSFFLLRQREMTPAVIKDAMAQWEGARGWPSWSLSNHDVIRFPTRLADDDPQRTKLMMALLLCATRHGVHLSRR